MELTRKRDSTRTPYLFLSFHFFYRVTATWNSSQLQFSKEEGVELEEDGDDGCGNGGEEEEAEEVEERR